MYQRTHSHCAEIPRGSVDMKMCSVISKIQVKLGDMHTAESI